MKMFDCFRGLLVFGEDIGTVERAHMYGDNHCSVEGIDHEGDKFTLSFTFERMSVCEKNNEEENER